MTENIQNARLIAASEEAYMLLKPKPSSRIKTKTCIADNTKNKLIKPNKNSAIARSTYMPVDQNGSS